MRLIDADILEREGWYLSRNYVVDSKTRCFESKAIKKVPTAHPELNEWCHDCKEYDPEKRCCPRWGQVIRTTLEDAQPERTCVNCGRTVNNGGWYADGGTRCPIEEHYALPKDGYCHLWEKRNVTDDNYPERREE